MRLIMNDWCPSRVRQLLNHMCEQSTSGPVCICMCTQGSLLGRCKGRCMVPQRVLGCSVTAGCTKVQTDPLAPIAVGPCNTTRQGLARLLL